ncbi:PLP-dependent aminotransferase family protein [Paenibacillus athensensis]|uniref:HTH gntR-type domain-containing protein n=1 Tax=Paenibacillus athensensis TaxID=1967502 RepID=A0A4Y8PRE8_9BACL|nr:PLP-dependent aminotransferase family protein [Paenibacillus athensensis]MCD1260760.1 PLP-dependent aminotransferase family protein [Paenibacillus athensensis]
MTSKYEAICAVLRQDIAEGRLAAGSKLPSIRELSRRFACSRNTVIHAYAKLEQEHRIYVRAKSGYYVVASDAAVPAGDNIARVRIDFAAAAPDAAVMPYEDFRHCMNKAVDLYKETLFTYGDPQGLLPLREQLSLLFRERQIFVGPERIVVCSGSQQALHLLAQLPMPNGKTAILVEEPTYAGMLRNLELYGHSVLTVQRGPDGLDWEGLERHFRNNGVKLFYTIPRFHNPTGASYSAHDKQRLAELAKRYDVFILEDDYLAELETDGKADPIYAYGGASHVLYVHSFSKTMLPGLRLAAAVVPPQLVAPLARYKSAADLSTSALSQGALEIYIRSGLYAHHTKRMRELYAARMRLLNATCRELLPAGAALWCEPAGGIFASVRLPDALDARTLAAQLAAQGIAVLETDRHFRSVTPRWTLIRLSVIRTDDRAIVAGVRALALALADAMRQQRKPGRPPRLRGGLL